MLDLGVTTQILDPTKRQKEEMGKHPSIRGNLIVPLVVGLSPTSTNHSSVIPLMVREEDMISLSHSMRSVSSCERKGETLLIAWEVHPT